MAKKYYNRVTSGSHFEWKEAHEGDTIKREPIEYKKGEVFVSDRDWSLTHDNHFELVKVEDDNFVTVPKTELDNLKAAAPVMAEAPTVPAEVPETKKESTVTKETLPKDVTSKFKKSGKYRVFMNPDSTYSVTDSTDNRLCRENITKARVDSFLIKNA